MLAFGGFDVVTATNGAEAVEPIETGLRLCLTAMPHAATTLRDRGVGAQCSSGVRTRDSGQPYL